jgi:peroxiredoxin
MTSATVDHGAAPLPAGTAAPDFSLPATPDQNLTLAELRGRPVILVFYPEDWSPVCSDQLALYQQLLPEFQKYDAELLGISVDGVWSHLAFASDRNLHFRCSPTSSRRVPSRGRTRSTGPRTARASGPCTSSMPTASSGGATSLPWA